MQFVTFIEINDWEGETWRFYIPISETNLPALQVLSPALISRGLGDTYKLDLSPVDESYVDKVVEKSRSGYMAYHNKCAGTLRLPEKFFDLSNEDFERALYKGGIEDFVKPE